MVNTATTGTVSGLDARDLVTQLAARGIQLDHRQLPANAVIEAPVTFGRSSVKGWAEIGAYSFTTGPGVISSATVGRFCSIAPGVIVGPNEHPTAMLTSHPIAYGRGASFKGDEYFAAVQQSHDFNEPNETTIGNDVWIGDGAFVRRGVKVGDGAIIAARAVVIRDVEPYEIVGGAPAKRIRLRFSEEIVQRLVAVRWWELDLRTCPKLDFSDVEGAVSILEAFREAGGPPLMPARYRILMNRQDGTRSLQKIV
jgi:acetyltransferase-like isoleucine patch superfamily enzyme